MAKKAVKKRASKSAATSESADAVSASTQIDRRISELHESDQPWRGEVLARVRKIILKSAPDIEEQWKWSVPVWACDGIICTGEAYKSSVKLTFAHGASLPDPAGLFNASLDGATRRAIDIAETDKVDADALQALVRSAIERNRSMKGAPASNAPPRLLSGGNPQIAKGYGEAPVRAYIDAMPGWKQQVGQRVDAIVSRVVPGVRKAVKWNSPLYGASEGTWFMGLHCLTKYVKVAFLKGASLKPVPPGESKQKHVRYLDIYEKDLAGFDEARFADWVKQAAALPGEKM